MEDIAKGYLETRDRLLNLVVACTEEQLQTKVPACPAWSVKDLLAHLVGNVSDYLEGRGEGVGTEEWTAHQVRVRRDIPISAVLAEWERRLPSFVEGFSGLPHFFQLAYVADIFNHEADIRGALGLPRIANGRGFELALEFYVERLRERMTGKGLQLRIRAREDELIAGIYGPTATLHVSDSYEMLRTISGRRNVEQILSLDWEGDPDVFVPFLSYHPYTTAYLEEKPS